MVIGGVQQKGHFLPVDLPHSDDSFVVMCLRCTLRRKDGKTHRYFRVVENRRVASGQVVQRRLLYLDVINHPRQPAWRKSIEVFDQTLQENRQISLAFNWPSSKARRAPAARTI